MKKAVGDVVYHCSQASDSDVLPQTAITWCKYQAAKLNGTNYTDNPVCPLLLKQNSANLYGIE